MVKEREVDSITWFIDKIKRESETVDRGIIGSLVAGTDKLISNNGFMYILPGGMKGDEPGFVNSLYFIASMSCSLFMSKEPTQKVPDKAFHPLKNEEVYIQSAVCRWLRKLNRVIDTSKLFSGRIYSENYSAQLTLMGEDKNGAAKQSSFFGTLDFSHDGIHESLVINIDIKSSDKIVQYYPRIPFYVGDKRKAIEEVKRLEHNTDYALDGRHLIHLSIIENILETIYDGMTSEISDVKVDYPHYTKEDIAFHRNCARMMHSDGFRFMVECYRLSPEEKSMEPFDIFNDKDPDHVFIEDNTDIPVVDISKRGWTYISKYWNGLEKHDIRDAFIEPRYGKIIKYTEDDNTIFLSYEMDYKKAFMRMYITHVIDKDVSAVAIIDMDNINNFSLAESIKGVKVMLWVNNSEKLPESYDKMKEDSPIFRWDPVGVLSNVLSAVQLFRIVKDRPNHTKVVRCTEQVHRNGKKHKSNKPEYKVTRILKTSTEAKRLVDESIHREPGERREAEYTMEEWDRIGHTRTYKDGHTVWIDATRCHRHKDLVDKEVHIKL